MKKMISKFLAGILTFSLILFSVPTVVNGAEEEVNGLVYRIGSGGLIITDCTDTSAKEITIPERATLKTGMKLKVVGIDDYAFGYCNNLSVIHVPDTLKNSNMGNVAFLNAKSIIDFTNGELKNNSTMENVIEYVAKQIYDTDKFTDEEMDEITAKFMDRINKVDTSSAATLEGKVMVLIKNIDKMGLTPQTINKFNTWISLVKYSDMTIKGESGTEIQQYVNGRSFLGLKYEITSTYPLSQENCNLYYVKLDKDNDGTYDSISITGYSGNIQEVKVPDKIDKLPIVDIAENAFSNAVNLNTIYLPKTIASVGEKSMGYLSDGTKIPGFVIYGYLGTYPERYANKNGFTFKDMLKVPVLSQTEVTLKVGEMIGINVENYDGAINWFSDDTTIATVSDGYIKGISGGEVTVYAELPDGTLLKCNVTIKSTPIISGIVTTGLVTTTGEPAISLTSKYTQPTTTTTAEPAISLTSKYTQPTTTTTAEPAISLTSKYTQPTTTTTAEPAISIISKQTTNTSVTTQTTIVTKISSVSAVSSTTQKTQTTIASTTADTSITPSSTSATQKDTTSSTVNTTLATSSTSATQSLNTTTSLVSITSVSSSSTAISNITQSTTVSIITSNISSSAITQTIPQTTTVNSSSTSATTTKTTTNTSDVITTETSASTTTITTITTSVSTVTTVSTNDDPEETKIVLLGDANDDGKVNVRDAAYIAKILSIRQDYVLPFYSDFNQDEKINVRDAAAIARVLASKKSHHWVQIIIKVRPI